jgi:very-short-patch-repair endonuclease
VARCTLDVVHDFVLSEDADDLDVLLYQQDAVLSVRQALRHVSKGALQHRVARGRWQRPYRGVVVTHSGPLTVSQRIWAGLLSVPEPALLGGVTAARVCGLRGYDEPLIHILVPAERRPCRSIDAPPAGSWPVIVHRTTVLSDTDAQWQARPPRTVVARSLVDAAQWAPDLGKASAMVVAGIQQRLTTAADLLEVLDRLPRARRHNAVRALVNDAAGGAHSLAEIDFIRLCRRHRLPLPDQQVRRTDNAGRTRYLDAYWRRWRLHVEIDGAQHMDVRNWWNDMHRQNQLWVTGDRVLRFPAWVVRQRPAEVASQIADALRAHGWSPDRTPRRRNLGQFG